MSGIQSSNTSRNTTVYMSGRPYHYDGTGHLVAGMLIGSALSNHGGYANGGYVNGGYAGAPVVVQPNAWSFLEFIVGLIVFVLIAALIIWMIKKASED